jgi:hypothetical protein
LPAAPARCQEYDEPSTAIAFPAPSIAVDTGTAGTLRVVTIVSLQVPDAVRVSNPVWPSSTDQATDACPALLSATAGVPIRW